nr:pyridoxamine 5'-phosphate oxidase family protein [uncultured Anaeromusa sp.]
MTVLAQQVIDVVNQFGKIGVLATADGKGQPNEAYFGTAGILPDGSFSVVLGNSRTLKNLQENPKAAYLVLSESPVTFATKGWRLYLRVRAIQEEGELLVSTREKIAEKIGAEAAAQLQAAVLFDVTEVRPLIDIP